MEQISEEPRVELVSGNGSTVIGSVSVDQTVGEARRLAVQVTGIDPVVLLAACENELVRLEDDAEKLRTTKASRVLVHSVKTVGELGDAVRPAGEKLVSSMRKDEHDVLVHSVKTVGELGDAVRPAGEKLVSSMRKDEHDEDQMEPLSDIKALEATVAGLSLSEPKRRILLILDLNGLLIFRLFKRKLKEMPELDPFVRKATTKGAFYAWKRPHVDSFLDFVFAHFDVACWSSAMEHNVAMLRDYVFGSERKLAFAWDQTKCVSVKHPDPTERKPLFKKPIKSVWSDAKFKHLYSADNTLLIDDSELKALDNPPNLLYCPAEWRIDCQDDAVNNALAPNGQIRQYLQRLLDSGQSVADFVKQEKEKGRKKK